VAKIIADHVILGHLLVTSQKGRGIPAPVLQLHANTDHEKPSYHYSWW